MMTFDTMIGQYMVRSPYCTGPNMTLQEADHLLKARHIRHLPVIDNRKLVGVISDRDIRAAINSSLAEQLTVGDVMVRDVFVAPSTSALSDVAAEMANNKYGCTIIVNEKLHVVGIFTTTDALRILAEMGESDAIENFLADEDEYQSFTI